MMQTETSRVIFGDIADLIARLDLERHIAVEALRWYSGRLRPEDRLNDNGDKATTALHSIIGKDAG